MKPRKDLTGFYVRTWLDYVSKRDECINGLEWKNEREKLILAFFARINSISHDILLLGSKDHFTSSEILMRSALETYVDLKCLLEDPTHVAVVKNSQVKKEIDRLQHYSPDNPYYAYINEEDVEINLERLRGEYDEKLNLKIFRRFEKANELDAYRTVYQTLCLYSHGNITALASNNFDPNQSNVILQSSRTDTTVKFILSSTTNLAIASCIEVLGYFSFDESTLEKFKSIMDLVNETTKAS